MENKHIFPGWEIVDELGSGAFSTVYKVRKTDALGVEYFSALKVITIPASRDEYRKYKDEGYDNESISQIFKDQVSNIVGEFRMLSDFRGTTNVVSYEDHKVVPAEDGIGWKVLIRMELLTTLPNAYNKKPLTVEDTIRVGIDICTALELCEKRSIIHRDIKPQNIFVNSFGDYKLGDFGIARTMDHTTRATKTGTPVYMAPEVHHGNKYNNTADIYSLGLVLYWLLNERRLPFLPLPPEIPTAVQTSEAQQRRLSGEMLPPPKNGNDTLKAIVLKACAFNSADRYRSASELKAALKKVAAAMGVSGAAVVPPAAKPEPKVEAKPEPKQAVKKQPRAQSAAKPVKQPAKQVALPDDKGADAPKKKKKGKAWIIIIIIIVIILLLLGLLLAGTVGGGLLTLLLGGDGGNGGNGGGNVDDSGTNTDSSEFVVESELVSDADSSYQPDSSVVEPSEDTAVYATVPNLSGESKEAAIVILTELGFVTPEIEELYSDSVELGHVIKQSAEAGKQLPTDTVITITVSAGYEPFDMPDVTGQEAEAAEKTLSDKGLKVHIEYEKTNEVDENKVISQSLDKGVKVKPGDSVTLTVSSGKATVAVENVVGKTKEEAKSMLEKQGFKVEITEDYDTSVAAGKVISQHPPAGSAQLPESVVEICVSKGKYSVKVSFNANGGTVSTASKTVYYTEKYGTLPTASRTGYTFMGWYTAQSGGTKISTSGVVNTTNNHTLYAHWAANAYRVTFNANGGTCSTSAKNYTYGSAYGTLPTASRTGYTFNGWYTAQSGGTKIETSTVMNKAGSQTLYAHWTVNNYYVKFDANGGTCSTAAKTYPYGSTYGTLPTATRDYYTFAGWYTAQSGGTKIEPSTVMNQTSTHTLYAHWTENPISGWVLASSVPSGALIVDNKWTYTKTETTESESASLSGYTQTGSYWKQTGSGSVNYASFPTGYDTNNTYYKTFAKSAYTSYDNGTTKRVVSDAWGGYIYWHWMYNVSYANVTNRTISHRSGYWSATGVSGSGYEYKYFFAIASTVDCPYLDKYYCCSQSLPSYNCHSIITNTTNVGTPRCFRFTYRTSSYVDYKKIYQYQKVTSAESTTQVTAGGTISNVQHYVRYRAK